MTPTDILNVAAGQHPLALPPNQGAQGERQLGGDLTDILQKSDRANEEQLREQEAENAKRDDEQRQQAQQLAQQLVQAKAQREVATQEWRLEVSKKQGKHLAAFLLGAAVCGGVAYFAGDKS